MFEWIALLSAVLYSLLLSHSSIHSLGRFLQDVGECLILATLCVVSSAVLVNVGALLLRSPLGVFGIFSPEYLA